jgi:putative tricarboxylic transport membrane protein
VATATVSSATFVFTPVAMTVILGEVVGSRIKHAYHRLTTVISVRNGVIESTYIAEALIPLIAFGLPLSPVAAEPAAPLFNAPPRFTVDSASGQVNNLHNLLSASEFLAYGMLAVVIAILIAYPFSMNFAHRAASFVSRRISHEAVIATFVGPCSACRPSSPCSAEMTLPCSATQPLRLRGFTRLQERKISDRGRFAAHRRQAGLPQVRRKTQP